MRAAEMMQAEERRAAGRGFGGFCGGGGFGRRRRVGVPSGCCKGSWLPPATARCGHDDWLPQMYAVGLGRNSSSTSVTQLMKANMSPTQETAPPLPIPGASRAPCPLPEAPAAERVPC